MHREVNDIRHGNDTEFFKNFRILNDLRNSEILPSRKMIRWNVIRIGLRFYRKLYDTEGLLGSPHIQELVIMTKEELMMGLRHMKNRRSGDDGATLLEMVRYGLEELQIILLGLFNDILVKRNLLHFWSKTFFENASEEGDPRTCRELQSDYSLIAHAHSAGPCHRDAVLFIVL